MDARLFADQFPALYHLTFTSNLESIKRYGLQSAAHLADTLVFDQDERDAALSRRRLCIQDIRGASLRDHGDASESKMRSLLVRITPNEWRALLNSKIFFFVSLEKTLRFAESYGAYESTILETDTRALLAMHAADASVCRLQSGSFAFRATPRGRDSFIPLANFVYQGKRDTPTELTLDCPVPELMSISQAHSVASYQGAGK